MSTVATNEKNLLVTGLYTPPEAAFYARVQTQLLKRWVFGGQRGQSVVVPELKGYEDRVVTFLDLIQVLAIRAIRMQSKIPLSKIREAVDLARTMFRIEYPFAVDHTTFLFSDQKGKGHGEIVLRVGEHLIQASGKEKKNFIMREIAELYLRDLKFDPHSGLANKYTPLKSGDCSIVLDPTRHFGEPVVDPCGYTAQTLWESVETEGGIPNAAKAFGIDESNVVLAWEYYDRLMSNTAA